MGVTGKRDETRNKKTGGKNTKRQGGKTQKIQEIQKQYFDKISKYAENKKKIWTRFWEIRHDTTI